MPKGYLKPSFLSCLFTGIWMVFIFAGCATPSQQVVVTQTPAPPASTPFPTKTDTALPSPTVTLAPTSIWIPSYLPSALLDTLAMPEGFHKAEAENQASLKIGLDKGVPLSTWVFALAAPFPTITDEISLADLKSLWTAGTAKRLDVKEILVTEGTRVIFENLWGRASASVRSLPAENILVEAWKKRNSWAILPFEQLEPKWKVISIDGQSPIHRDFDLQSYALKAVFSLTGDAVLVDQVIQAHGPGNKTPVLTAQNWDAKKMTTIELTGVTALVRGTAALMERNGMDYPARDIGPVLRDADILHISNEIPFAKNCPAPYNWSSLVFCSQERYIQLLDSIHPTVIDMSGDHFADWGPEAMLFTLDLYRQRGWKYYGGGVNKEEAERPALIEHNGNKIAFLGCNYKELGYATASATNPGAVHCDPNWLYPAVKKVKEEGYLPIVTFQDLEYYEMTARPRLQTDFRGVADAGAVIVSGSQAHLPQAFEFNNGSLLHYGLGNLFFDQVHSQDSTDKAFIDRHVIYAGRYISTELITIQFVDYARARLMTPQERQTLLGAIFTASGW